MYGAQYLVRVSEGLYVEQHTYLCKTTVVGKALEWPKLGLAECSQYVEQSGTKKGKALPSSLIQIDQASWRACQEGLRQPRYSNWLLTMQIVSMPPILYGNPNRALEWR